jgi:hypothetical protein
VLLATELVRSATQPGPAFPSGAAYLLTMAAITAVCAACWLAALALPRRSATMPAAAAPAA